MYKYALANWSYKTALSFTSFFQVKHHSIYQTVCVIMDKCGNSYGAKIVINSNNSCLKYTLQYKLDNDLFSFKTFNTLSNL